MRRLIIIAFFFMNLCLPMGTQASNGGNVSPDPIFRFISVSDSRTWREMPPSKTRPTFLRFFNDENILFLLCVILERDCLV